ncbi:MAG: tetratricopeptide repeat protein [Spirochaetaceae bacterium]|nr:MAG: tetratricopeptide repeat protein [Spirochaetaceae bacterium]
MVTPVLKTKLYIPTLRPELVHRDRLIENLQAGIRRRLTLVSAPAGFGKTTLIGAWIRQIEQPVAWLSLDESDNDPVRFLSYFIAALQTIQPKLADGLLSDYQPLKSSAAESVLTQLLNEIADIEGHCIVVFDDYHLIGDSTIHRHLGFLLEHLPAQVHLVICTRSDPPLPLAALRARGQMTELRAEDLRFTREETAEFLNRLMGLDLTGPDIQVLADHTEGWIAGLQMAAVSLQGRPDTSGFIKSFTGSNRYILDYLVEEVLSRQPENIQQFLLKTSVLDRLTGPLCEVVSGERDCGAILEHLDRHNLFIVPLDSERLWYRYHRLFGDLLRHRAEQNYSAQMSELHRRASRWYEQHGMIAEAIDQTLAEKDFERAMELIEDNAQNTLMRSEFATLLRWIEALPQDLVCKRPLLCVYFALGLLMAGAPLNQIQAQIDAAVKADTGQQISGQLAAFRAFLSAIQGDIDESLRQSNLAMELLPEEELFFRSVISRIVANVTYATSGDIPKAVRIFEENINRSRAAGNITIVGALMSELGELRTIQGRLHEARRTYEQVLEQTVDDTGNLMPVAGLAMMGLGNLLREWNDLDSAERQLNEGIELVRNLGVVGTLDGYIALARVKQAQNLPHEAQAVMDTVHKIAARFDASDLDDLLVNLQRARLWLIQNRVDSAARWRDEWVERRTRNNESIPFVLKELDQILHAHILLAQGKLEDCLKVLKQLQKTAEKLGRYGIVLESLVLQSLAASKQGDNEQSLQSLEEALIIAEPEGFLRLFLDEGEPMAQLLYQAANKGLRREYVGRLLAAFPPSRESQVGISEHLIEALSQREIEVLQLLAKGSSNKEVARQLFISLPTVKWHTSNIYGKLGVQNRTQAVAKARALGLIALP